LAEAGEGVMAGGGASHRRERGSLTRD
jgi:hypothetical protein